MLIERLKRALAIVALVAPLLVMPLVMDMATAQDKAKPTPDRSTSTPDKSKSTDTEKPAGGKSGGPGVKKGDDNGTGK